MPNVGWEIFFTLVIMVIIFLISHLTTDRDMPKSMKVIAWIVFGGLSLLYLIFGVFNG
jgi:hypothetical protein